MTPARTLAGRAPASARPASSHQRPGARKYSDAFEARVCAAYLAGRDAREVARTFKIPRPTVSTIVLRHGIQLKRTDSIKQQIIAGHARGLDIEHIARLAMTSRSYVKIVLQDCGLLSTVVFFVAFTLWSSVMPQSAKAYQPTTWEFLNLPIDKLRAIETEGRKPKHIPRQIDIRTIPPASQAALISISDHELCQVMTTKLKASTVRFNVHDFAVLRDLRLVERAEGNRWHVLMPDGKAYAHQVAQQIANEMGLHVIWTAAGASRYFRTVHCTCGWSTRLYSERFDANADHRHRIARHLAEAAGATRPLGET